MKKYWKSIVILVGLVLVLAVRGWSIDPIQLHLDKAIYNSGDVVRFKGYILEEKLRGTLDFRMVFFETASSRIIKDSRLRSEQLLSGISFELSDSLRSGIYQLLIFDEHYVNVLNQTPIVLFNLKNENIDFDPNTEPEIRISNEGGGDLVAGVENILVARCMNLEGQNKDYTLNVYDQNDSILQRQRITQSGLVRISITPTSNTQYKVGLEKENKMILSRELPKVVSYGVKLSLDQSESKRIFLNLSFIDLLETNYQLQIVHDQQLVSQYQIKRTSRSKYFDPSQLPYGILNFRVLDSKGQVIKSRLFFNLRPVISTVSILPEKSEYRPGEKIRVKILKLNNDNVNLSSCVWDTNQIRDLISNRQNIESLHFSNYSIITSNIGNYFDQSETTEWGLDNLMISLEAKDQRPKIKEPHVTNGLAGIYLMGQVTPSNEQVASPRGAILSIPDSDEAIRFATVDENGKFLFPALDFSGIKKGYLTVWPPTNEKYNWSFDNPKLQLPLSTISLKGRDRMTLDSLMKYQRIRERIRIQYTDYRTLNGPRNNMKRTLNTLKYADSEIKLDNFVRFPDVKTVIKEVVPFVQYKKNRFKVFSPDLSRTFPGKPLVLLNGIPVQDTIIMSQNPSIFEKIEVVNRLQSIYVFGKVAENGIVAFYTREGHSLDDLDLAYVEMKGYHKNVDSDPPLPNSPEPGTPYLPDLLYWNEYLDFQGKDEIVIEFRAPDYETSLAVHIEGTTQQQRYAIIEKLIKITY